MNDVAVSAKYLETVRGDRVHCRYWRRNTGTDDESDVKARKN